MNKITTSGKAKTPPGRFASQSVVGQEEQCSSTFSSFRHRVSRESWIHHLENVSAERQNMSINHLNFFFIQTASSALITHIIKTAFRREVLQRSAFIVRADQFNSAFSSSRHYVSPLFLPRPCLHPLMPPLLSRPPLCPSRPRRLLPPGGRCCPRAPPQTATVSPPAASK